MPDHGVPLSQDLTELFLKYHIPADLLTAGPILAGPDEAGGGGGPAAGADKVGEVKGHVQAMQELIAAARQRELHESQEAALHAVMSRVASPPASSSCSVELEYANEECEDQVCFAAAMSQPVFEKAAAPRRGLMMRMMKSLAPSAAPRSAQPRCTADSFSPPPPPPPPPPPRSAGAGGPPAPPPPAVALAQAMPPPPAAKERPVADPAAADSVRLPAGKDAQPAAPDEALEGKEGAVVDYTRLPAELDRRCAVRRRAGGVGREPERNGSRR